ncbi:MazG nucleotide pyrophosphohydrolase domain-containing protein [Clostridium sp. DL1XJH146]
MKFIMPILDKNEKLGIDNNNASWEQIGCKVLEEAIEVAEAIINGDHKNLAEELQDSMQIAITALDKLSKERNIAKDNHRHLGKLKDRGWENKGFIEAKIFKMKC